MGILIQALIDNRTSSLDGGATRSDRPGERIRGCVVLGAYDRTDSKGQQSRSVISFLGCMYIERSI